MRVTTHGVRGRRPNHCGTAASARAERLDRLGLDLLARREVQRGVGAQPRLDGGQVARPEHARAQLARLLVDARHLGEPGVVDRLRGQRQRRVDAQRHVIDLAPAGQIAHAGPVSRPRRRPRHVENEGEQPFHARAHDAGNAVLERRSTGALRRLARDRLAVACAAAASTNAHSASGFLRSSRSCISTFLHRIDRRRQPGRVPAREVRDVLRQVRPHGLDARQEALQASSADCTGCHAATFNSATCGPSSGSSNQVSKPVARSSTPSCASAISCSRVTRSMAPSPSAGIGRDAPLEVEQVGLLLRHAPRATGRACDRRSADRRPAWPTAGSTPWCAPSTRPPARRARRSSVDARGQHGVRLGPCLQRAPDGDERALGERRAHERDARRQALLAEAVRHAQRGQAAQVARGDHRRAARDAGLRLCEARRRSGRRRWRAPA